jgi:formylmethanofuran dehydrogenase subunit B
MTDTRVDHVTCLGCGCGCDDIAVTVREGRIVETSPPCPVGRAWFGDGAVPWQVLRNGEPAGLEEALLDAATLLLESQGRLLVYIGLDLSSQAQRIATTLADLLRATVDTATSESAAAGILAGQRRGRATATLGEIRNRADVIVFWGTDPARRYPRFYSRYAPEPAGIQVPSGRAGRFVIAVNVGADTGPVVADATLTLDTSEEIAALSMMRAAVLGRQPNQLAAPFTDAVNLVPRLTGARYAVLIHDAEPTAEPRDPLRAEGLIALAQTLNGPTRAALCSLRAGGNRPGAESVLTWQTGYPFAVDYSRGYPRYAPTQRGLDRLQAGGFSTVLIVGSPPPDTRSTAASGHTNIIAIGPRVSQAFFSARVAIDTGVAGIHEAGTGYRLDEVPLSLRPPLASQRSTSETLAGLMERIRLRGSPA